METYDSLASAIDAIHIFHRLWQDTKKGLPIRHSEMSLLLLIVKSDTPITSVIAADSLKVKKQMITTMTKALEKEGFIKKQASLEDGRSLILSSTEHGRDFVAQRYKEYFKTVGLLQEKLGEKDFATWITLLNKASSVLEELKSK